MDNHNVIDFLIENSNIAIRYRTKRDLLKNTEEANKIHDELLYSERAVFLLNCLNHQKEFHGATLYAVENSLNMLIDMGFQYEKGFSEFDKIVNSITEKIKNKKIDDNHVLGTLNHVVTVPFLLRAGIRDDYLINFTKERINLIYDFVKQKNYDIYDDVNKYKNIPKNFQNRPIIKHCLYENGKMKFPLEYDSYGFASLFSELNFEYQCKINEIISYILDDKFSQIADDYGVLTDKKNYWAMGWVPKVTDLKKGYCYNPLLLKLDLMSNFSVAKKSKWFSQSIEFINQFVDEKGFYHYPKNYLTEKNSCWILANRMSLGENRKRKNALLIEGTFRTLLILEKVKTKQ